MRTLNLVVLLTVFALPTTLRADKPIPVDPLMALQGSWNIVSGVNQGKKLTDKELKGSYAVVEKNTIVTYDRDKNETYRAEFSLVPSTDPTQINMTAVVRGNEKSESKGITKITSHHWTLCYALPGESRPKEFKSTKEGKTMLFELEKVDVPSDDPEE